MNKNKIINNYKKHGFTLIEVLIISPIVILIIGIFISAIVSMTGDVLSTRGTNALSYNIQDALDRIEKDVNSSGSFLATNNIALTSPQGLNDDTTNFHNVGAGGTMLILNDYATSSNPLNSTSDIIYSSGQPNPCSSNQITKNPALMINIIYFIKNNTLWRRTILPANYTTVGCGTPWQEPSCTPGVSGAFCKTKDIELVKGLNNTDGFVVNYYPNPSSTIPNTVANNSTQSDSARLAAMRTNNSIVVTINATGKQSGREISQTGTMRATSPNNNTTKTSVSVIPTMLSQPQNKTVSSSDTNVKFTATASGTNPTVQWQQSTDLGTTWTNVSGATSTTLTLATVSNTMDGYKYRAVFTNAQGSVTSSSASLWVNLLSWTSLTFQNSWTYYGDGYSVPRYIKTSSGMVNLTGLIKRVGTPVQSEVIAVLPVSYRPSATLIFTVETGPNVSARVDIASNGEIRYITGSKDWLSLDTIHFMPDTGRYTRTAATLANGWTNLGGSFAPASYTVDSSNRVNLQGVVAPGTLNTQIYNLPANMLPSQLMYIPALNYNEVTIDYRAGSTGVYSHTLPGSGWISTMASYYPASSNVSWSSLSFVNGWVNNGGIYTTAQYTKSSDGLVSLKGLVRGGTATAGTVIATLPFGYRPDCRLLISTLSADASNRIDIDTGGNIVIMSGSSTWVSLDGITFYSN